MKLNNADLRQIFFLSINESIPKKRNKCPAPKKMLRFSRGKISEKKQTNLVDHITSCSHCAREFEFVVKAFRFEEDMNRIVQKLKNHKKDRSVFSLHSWKYASLVMGTALICFFILIFTFPPSYKSRKLRDSELFQINLLEPHEKIIPNSSLYFQWENITGAEYYTFELYDETLYQVWASNKIYKNSFFLSQDVTNRFEPNKPYFWMISAFFPNGRKVESPLKEIFLTQ